MHRLAWLPLLLGLSVPLIAQRVSIRGGAPASFSGRSGFGHHSPAPLLYPFGLSPFYWDGVSNAGPRDPAEPRIIVVQQPTAPAEVPSAPPAQPLLIELHGDHYVQVSGEGSAAANHEQPLSVSFAGEKDTVVRSAVIEKPSRVVLVFRDGHREEIPTYTISSGVLYAGADSLTGSTAPRSIAISALNLQDTVESNRSRGVRFLLPSAGNEVVVGP